MKFKVRLKKKNSKKYEFYTRTENLEVIPMRVVRKYAFVAYLSARSNVAYLGEVMSRVVFLAVILYVFSRLWQAVFLHCDSGRLGGLSLSEMIWYLVITEAITLSAPRVSDAVDLDVRSGSIVNYLQKPLSYPVYSLASNFGERFVRFLVNLAAGSLIAFALVKAPAFSFAGLAFFLVSLPLAFAVDFLACFLIGLLAFWLEDTSGIFLIYSRLKMILGGMLFPITLFPEGVQALLEWLPFSSCTYVPARLLVAPSEAEFVGLVFKQLVGLLVLAVAVAALYEKANKRVFVNGG